MLLSGMRKEDVAAEVYSFLARSVARLICSACKTAGVNRALIAGGVASSNLLRNLLKIRVSKLNSEIRLYWGKPELSGDNACGVALIGAEMNERKAYGSDH
jgi:N6-L-threonylcarbamoyladenine synthase